MFSSRIHSKKMIGTYKLVIVLTLIFAGIVRAESTDQKIKDVRILVDTSRTLQVSDPLQIRKVIPDLTVFSMLESGDYFGVWAFGDKVASAVSYGKYSEKLKNSTLSNRDYVKGNSQIRNLRTALEKVSFTNVASSKSGADVILVVDGGLYMKSPIKEALLQEHILKKIIPKFQKKGIRINVLELSNRGELFYRELVKLTDGKYLSLRGAAYPSLSATRFLGAILGYKSDLARNASIAITNNDADVTFLMTGVGNRELKLTHPDGKLLDSSEILNGIQFVRAGPNAYVKIPQEEFQRLDLNESFWAVLGANAPGVVVVGESNTFIAGAVPSIQQLSSQRALALSRPKLTPKPPVLEDVEPDTVEDFQIEEEPVNLMDLVQGEVGIEGRYFGSTGFTDYHENFSIYFQPEIDYLTDSGDDLFEVSLFFRLDQHDSERTHFDVREALWTHVWEDWETKVGIGKVFWGVTESQHLVDIVNQTDQVEQPDLEDKLGQPMIKLGLEYDWGNLDLFLLPFFRERTFPGEDGRLTTPIPVDTSNVVYDSGAEANRTDVAVRLYGYVDDFEYALSWFSGTSREPLLSFNGDVTNPKLIQIYEVIDQAGLEMQYIYEDWLLKFEGISRSGMGSRYAAVTTGFEYTQVGIFDGDSDLGWVAEYLWDERGDQASSFLEHDVFIGWRWTANDVQSTTALLGGIWDLETEEAIYSLEAERRLSSNMKLELNIRMYEGRDSLPRDPMALLQSMSQPNVDNKLAPLNREDHVQLAWTMFF